MIELNKGDTWFISKSQLECFKICPWSFKRRYIDKVRTPSTPAMEMGTRFHEFAERFFVHFDKLSANKWFDFVPTSFSSVEQDMARWFLNYERDRFNSIPFERWMPLKLEDKLRSPTQYLSGIIDRVDWCDPDDKTVTLIEYKTGNSVNASSIRQQGAFYKMLWDEFYPDITATQIKLINPKIEKEYVFDIKSVSTRAVNEHIAALRDAISCDLFPRDCSIVKYGYCGLCNIEDVEL